MKNVKKFLALSLLLSVPSIGYAMESSNSVPVEETVIRLLTDGVPTDVVEQATDKAAEVVDKLLDKGVSTEVANNIANQIIKEEVAESVTKPWYSNWSYPSTPSFIESGYNNYVAPGVEYAKQTVGSGYNNYIAPGVEYAKQTVGYKGAGAALGTAAVGKVGYDVAMNKPWVSQVRPNLEAGYKSGSDFAGSTYSRFKPSLESAYNDGMEYGAGAAGSLYQSGQGLVNYGADYAGKLYQSGLGLTNSGADYAGKLFQDNPEIAGPALFAATTLGAWLLFNYKNPSKDLRTQKDVNSVIADFMREHNEAIAKEQENLRARVAKEALESQRLAELAEREAQAQALKKENEAKLVQEQTPSEKTAEVQVPAYPKAWSMKE